MAWEIVQSVWFIPAALGALGVLAFLRILAIDRRNMVQEHETARNSAKVRCDYERLRRERQRRQQQTNEST